MVLRKKFGETEIENLGGTALGREDIRGLDVAVHDTFFVSGIEGIRKLNPNIHGAGNRDGADRQKFIERLSFEQFHGDEGFALVFFDRMNGANAGMIQGGGRARFPQEALERLRVEVSVFGKEFQGDAAAELRIFGFVNDAHTAATELTKDAIVGDGFVEHGSRGEMRMVDARRISVKCVWKNGGRN